MIVLPHQSPFAICVLDVEPNDIVGHVVLIEASIDSLDIGLVPVVPAALVVPDGEVLRQGCCACQPGILGRHLQGSDGVVMSNILVTRITVLPWTSCCNLVERADCLCMIAVMPASQMSEGIVWWRCDMLLLLCRVGAFM